MIIKLGGLNKSYSEQKRSGIPKARKPCNLALIAFVIMRPNLVFLWHYGKNFQATTGDCKLAAPIKFIRGTSAGKLDSFQLNFISMIFLKAMNLDP